MVLNKKQLEYKAFQEKLFNKQILDDESLMTKKEVAKLLNVSVKMIDRKVCLNEIPLYKIGRLVRFKKSEILAWAKGE